MWRGRCGSATFFCEEKMDKNRIQQVAAQADVYRLLSACFYQPENALSEEQVFAQLTNALKLCAPQLAPQAEKMGAAFAAESLENLLLDYTCLFLGPFEILAKPYGSCYLEGEKVVMGHSTMNALECYRAGGFEPDAAFHEMPDHVAVELEFLYLLSFRTAKALADDDNRAAAEVQTTTRTFLHSHIGRWVADFSGRIVKGAELRFYPLLAELLLRFVKQQESRC
jgi:TorA maturation chaperone TorD